MRSAILRPLLLFLRIMTLSVFASDDALRRLTDDHEESAKARAAPYSSPQVLCATCESQERPPPQLGADEPWLEALRTSADERLRRVIKSPKPKRRSLVMQQSYIPVDESQRPHRRAPVATFANPVVIQDEPTRATDDAPCANDQSGGEPDDATWIALASEESASHTGMMMEDAAVDEELRRLSRLSTDDEPDDDPVVQLPLATRIDSSLGSLWCATPDMHAIAARAHHLLFGACLSRAMHSGHSLMSVSKGKGEGE